MADDATLKKAGKVLVQTKKEAARESAKADKQASTLQRAYLTAVAKAIIWAQIDNTIEEESDDIESFAERIGSSVEDLAQSNPKGVFKDLARDAKKEASDFMGSGEGIEDTLDIDGRDMVKAINSVRI